jgi:hypothetical protein
VLVFPDPGNPVMPILISVIMCFSVVDNMAV